jgi:hypothetical protein
MSGEIRFEINQMAANTIFLTCDSKVNGAKGTTF